MLVLAGTIRMLVDKSDPPGPYVSVEARGFENRLDALPDLRAKKMAGINRSFLFQSLIRITSLTYVPMTGPTRAGQLKTPPPKDADLLCSSSSNAAGKAMRTH
jgi:hypothetical protein